MMRLTTALALGGLMLAAMPASANEALDRELEAVKAECDVYAEGADKPRRYEFEETLPGNDQASKFTLVEVPCWRAAYNFGNAYFLLDSYGDVERITFAQPVLDTQMSGDGEDAKLLSTRIVGFSSTRQLTNPSFDPATRTLTSSPKGRGIGDVSSSGTWVLRGARFVLLRYEDDPTYNGKEDPVTVFDAEKGIWGYNP
ncbi:DUF1176 domain-containing protein [Pseudahrensia aquimaris]|uniref:DUF1176 domain-containing protein n=1 Tax=Pseudahrensia aquimaris TaxID=744461 RepID=A0ABW3FM82_9HYPH